MTHEREVAGLGWRTILVPTDFSECARDALELATKLAALHGAKVVLLHAIELGGGLTPATLVQPDGAALPLTVEEYTRGAMLEGLAELTEPYRERGVRYEYRVEYGPAPENILDAVAAVGADLIVVGTHGRTGFAHLVLGSVAERVVRHARVPVLTVRRPDTPRGKTSRPSPERALDDESAG